MTLANSGLFSQLLHIFPRGEFASLVTKHQAQRYAKGFTCFAQFVAMLFCHLARAESLREIENGLRSCAGKLRHLGLGRVPARSTLSYANAHRTPALFADVFFTTLKRLRAQSMLGPRKHPFKFKNKLLSLDATIISLSLRAFPWADYNRTKGGIKVHVVLNHADYLPEYVCVSAARRHEITYARTLALAPGSVVAMDRAFMDFRLLSAWNEQGVFFVTPHKSDVRYVVRERRAVPAGNNIISDELVELGAKKTKGRYRPLIRRISLLSEDVHGQQQVLVLLTNQLTFAASTIGEIYKERWQIELFFKALKQNLTLRSFVGTNENAMRIQIWTALIAMLLLKWLHYLSQYRCSLNNLATAIRLNLFTYRDLQHFLNDPWDPPPEPPGPCQLSLGFADFGQPK